MRKFLKKEEIAYEIHRFVMETKSKGGDIYYNILNAPNLMYYMKIFKQLMDNSKNEEMDELTKMYQGFYEFGLFLSDFAEATSSGALDDILLKENV